MANKRQRKKQMKKQMKLMEQIKLKEVEPVEKVALIDEPEEFIKPWVNPVIIDSGKEYPTGELFLGKYECENKEYQALLDKRYPEGRIKPIEKYINNHSSILHHCNKCGQDFFGKPIYMLGEDHQKHVCTMPYGDKDGERLEKVGGRYKSKKKNTLNADQFYNMVWNDYTYKEIAKKLQVNPDIIEYYFKEEGLI
jgi:NACalpha-BTF3-like transcription factor